MKTLLTAHWTNLVTATFETDKHFLQKYLPAKTELNDWNARYFMSIVAFLFEKPRLLGIPSPFYNSFEEINLRFYVRRKLNNEWRKGVVFIKEIAPYYIPAQTAKWLYRENFISVPMKHEFINSNKLMYRSYACKISKEWNYLNMESACIHTETGLGDVENFIRDHYWAYTRKGSNKTLEFQIEHPPWKIFPAIKFDMHLDTGTIYGEQFKDYFAEKPVDAFLMDGSYTKVSWPVML
jgi:uncharacterized protein